MKLFHKNRNQKTVYELEQSLNERKDLHEQQLETIDTYGCLGPFVLVGGPAFLAYLTYSKIDEATGNISLKN